MSRIDSDVPGQASLDYEAWRDLVRTMGGRFNPEGVDPTTFTGWVRPLNVCDFIAAEVGSNAPRLERTNRDVRLDGVDQYFTVFQLAGRSGMTHNDEAMRVEVGDVVLVDVARPATFVAEDQGEPWNCITLSLPRQSLVSHLGFEPRGGLCRRPGTTAGRLLLDLIRSCERDEGSASPPADPYMRLAVYDLVGSLFAPTEKPCTGTKVAGLFCYSTVYIDATGSTARHTSGRRTSQILPFTEGMASKSWTRSESVRRLPFSRCCARRAKKIGYRPCRAPWFFRQIETGQEWISNFDTGSLA